MLTKDMLNKEIEKGTRYLIKNDPVLFRIFQKHGKIQLVPDKKYFQFLVKAIIYQQLSVKAAASILKKFISFYSPCKFPKPEMILATEDIKLRECGISAGKIKYLKDLCTRITDKRLVLNKIEKMNDAEVLEYLIQVKGIGPWTAEMVLIFSLGRLNVLPWDDLGIRNSIKANYRLRAVPTKDKVMEIARKNKWSPYCSIASLLLWRSLDNE